MLLRDPDPPLPVHQTISKKRMAVVVGVPYQILADQWAEEFKLFNINPIICYGNSSKWKAKIYNRIADIERSGPTKQLMVLIVVNASLLNPDIFVPITHAVFTLNKLHSRNHACFLGGFLFIPFGTHPLILLGTV